MLYHSALTQPVVVNPAERFECEGVGLVFRHDITEGLTREFDRADVLYSEPAWRAGFETFNRRANVTGQTYETYMGAIARVIRGTRRPLVLTTGAHARKLLPEADEEIRGSLNGKPCIVLAYRYELNLPDYSNTFAVLHQLAKQFDCVGDFCCGYGRSGRVFNSYGKQFVMSDYNASCVGSVAKQMRLNWCGD